MPLLSGRFIFPLCILQSCVPFTRVVVLVGRYVASLPVLNAARYICKQSVSPWAETTVVCQAALIFRVKTGKFNKPVNLHKLPTKTSVRKSWIIAISRKQWTPTSYTRVCSDHFRDGVGPNYFNKDKIPTENLAQKSYGCEKHNTRKNPLERSVSVNSESEVKCVSTEPQVPVSELARPNVTVPGDRDGSTTHDDNFEMHFRKTLHSYFKDDNIGLLTDVPAIEGEKGTQTDMVQVCDVSMSVQMPDLTIEDIKHDDEDIMQHTGLPDYTTFKCLFDTLVDFGMGEETSGPSKKLRLIDEFFMVMMRLRLGLLVNDLRHRFKVDSSTVSRIFGKWIRFMSEAMQSLIYLPTLKVMQSNSIPKCFSSFCDTRIVLDCTEIFIQTPSSLKNKSTTYSNYKSHNTFKSLVGVSMTGAVVFLSKLWGGCASDVEITRESGLLGLLDAGDAVMVDKGFIHIKSDLTPLKVKLYCPPFKTKEQFNKDEVECTRRIASARIHVERKMEQIKKFRLLQGIMPIALAPMADDIVFVCAALTNLLPPLVKS